MPKGDGRRLRGEPTTDFGRRLEAEFLALGYVTMADRARALSGFSRELGYPEKVDPVQIRQWLTGVEPRLGAAKVLEAIGVDMHFCLTGRRAPMVAVMPADGFDLKMYAEKVAATFSALPFAIRWTAEETLATVRFRTQDGMHGAPDVYDAFETVMRTRAKAAGVNPITACPPDGLSHYEWLDDAQLVSLATWFEWWAAEFGIVRTAPPYSSLLEAMQVEDSSEARDAISEAWESMHFQRLRRIAFFLAWDPPVPGRHAA